ncbi:MAG: LacI family DNA-binding transcriptional regulator [Microbacterium sp.]
MTLRDVAQAAGVAPPTASRVLNDDPTVQVRDDTRQRIIRAARELGYTPNSVARSLRGSRAGAIGLVMHDLDSPINVAVLKGAQSRCAEAGYVTLLADAHDLEEDQSQLRTFLARGRLDGVILQTGYGEGDDLVEQVANTVPAVLVNSEQGDVAPSVSLDDVAAATLATDHLLGLGHERVVFVGGPVGSPSSERREHGYRQAIEEAGLAPTVIPATWVASGGAAAAQEIMGLEPRPTAVVVANAITAAGVLSAFRDAQVSVPDDVSVVGIHDPWFVEHLPVALTTVRMPLFALGSVAADMLIEALNGGSPAAEVFIDDPPPELVVRRSSARITR